MFLLFILFIICESSICSVDGHNNCVVDDKCNSYCKQTLNVDGSCELSEYTNKCLCNCHQKVVANELFKNLNKIKIKSIYENFCVNVMNKCNCDDTISNECLKCIERFGPQCKNNFNINNNVVSFLSDTDLCDYIYCVDGAALVCCPPGQLPVCKCVDGIGYCHCE